MPSITGTGTGSANFSTMTAVGTRTVTGQAVGTLSFTILEVETPSSFALRRASLLPSPFSADLLP